MNTLITKNYFSTLKYFVESTIKDIYFLVNIAIFQDACVREIANLLIAARNRNVDISGIVNTKSPRTATAWNSKIFGRTLERYGCSIYYAPKTTCMHAKVFCFDRKNIIIGSHNLSGSADKRNMEVSVLISDDKLCLRFLDAFENFKNRCQKKLG